MKGTRTALVIAAALILCLGVTLWAQGRGGPKANPEDILTWKGKTIVFFGPHEDDDLSAAGTMAKLVKNGNKVYIVLYTSGNKGSRDLDMTAETAGRNPETGRLCRKRSPGNSKRKHLHPGLRRRHA